MPQLTLFDISEKKFLISYWAYPFDKNGNEIRTVMQKWEEEITESRIEWFIHTLKLIECVNIKIIELKNG